MSPNSIVQTFGVPACRLRLVADETLNDSDKVITVPAGKRWRILWIAVELITTAVGGNRTIGLEIRDSDGDIIYTEEANEAQAANATILYEFLPGVPKEAVHALAWNHEILTLPPIVILDPGYDIRIRDVSAVDAAADDMDIQIMVLEGTT